ncbi:MAG: hypothetical protein HUU02_00290 [Bacteroidetes bacterium]|nr:hypothetical protein [Bacteroidota bacterium]
MKQSISILMMVVLLLTSAAPLLSAPPQSQPLTAVQMESVVGGKDVVECTALLLSCISAIGPVWWASLICAGLTAYCLSVENGA